MTEQQLIKMGFKKKKLDDEYWYEFRTNGHLFLTNDTFFNEGKDEWIIGYQKTKGRYEEYWFNQRLKDASVFIVVFHLLTGREFKLVSQRKLIS
jgi:hypothetical protein